MVTPAERKLMRLMCQLKVWHFVSEMRLPWLMSRFGDEWGKDFLIRWLLRRQKVDDLHHAPCCPANHYCRARFVFQYCNCGAAAMARGTLVIVEDPDARKKWRELFDDGD